MIKIKILNPTKDRNEPTFRPFFFIKDMLRDYSIDITESDDFDFLIIGMSDFWDMSLTLKDSVEWGLENVDKLSEGGDYFLFDGFDSTSLLGAYEVFEKSNAIYLFKNQLLKDKDEYKNKYAYGKWWFGTGSGLDVSYDINDNLWSRIKLSGFNLGCQLPDYHNHYEISNDKIHDICAIYQGVHKPVPFNQVTAPGIQYTEHRKGAWDILENFKDKYSILADRLPKQEYLQKLWQSKLALSPFGQGEICYRDFELMQFGTLMVKPDMSRINTFPNPYVENENYVPVKADWSDLMEKIEDILINYKKYSNFSNNFRQKFKEVYSWENVCLYWYNIFKNLDTIKIEGIKK
tara:strand:+ start:192 stop:1235 length:1044 start_codon:yes stop_codon:yes gene_type:complete